ncbi:MAG: alpha-amylase family glycosyl hydrolase [Dehalococcoidales bacterium]|nr:alpha-amylase family glycosyl hydrolase [Dehalococcoidales bacterium]
MRRHPHLYELNAHIFLRRVSQKYGRALTLATIPGTEWQSIANQGFDLVWLMGVWQRSSGARQLALIDPGLRQECRQILPDCSDDDIGGSSYAISAFELHPALGGKNDLAQLKSKLNSQGLGLILDFVPNHLALDHHWVFSHPDWFVPGKAEDSDRHPGWFFSPTRGTYLAHGRDPYFPPWTDTVQLNLYSVGLRQALINELAQISAVSDGVRCDMAMLALNEVFERVWGNWLPDYSRQKTEFWAEALGRIKNQRPDFLFLAEVYWDLELKLQQMGFDFTYDKVLYDRLRFAKPGDIRRYLAADGTYQQRSMHFIENHDEPRAVTVFGRDRSLAAAAVMATVPGLHLFHEGQLEGRRRRLPVQLLREPSEELDPRVKRFYDQLLGITNTPLFHEGEWQLIEADCARENDGSHHNLLAWCWRFTQQIKLVVINYSPRPAQGRLRLDLPPGAADEVIFQDEFTNTTFTGNQANIADHGFYVSLDPWQSRILDIHTP